MGMSKLNIWITDLGRSCEMAKRDYVVAIFTCDGKVLEWCGRKYESIPAKRGHAEVEVPPGCAMSYGRRPIRGGQAGCCTAIGLQTGQSYRRVATSTIA